MRELVRRLFDTRIHEIRDEWVEKQLAKLPAGIDILDAGCGEQKYRAACPHLHYFTQDFAQYTGGHDGIAYSCETWKYGELNYTCDITAIPAPDGSFDAILCTEVFEHVPDPLTAMREFTRLLRPAGTLIITVPFCAPEHQKPYFFYAGLSDEWFERACKEHKLELVELTHEGNVWWYLSQELRRARGCLISRWARVFYAALTLPALIALKIAEKLQQKDSDYLHLGHFVIARKY
ncbi:MAG: class I SAM-dependent methyltransferase [Terracidiphilus sp.]|jgi:SAM-dependent methyltransferase